MRLIERLGVETEAFHHITDEEALRLLGSAAAEDYRRYLVQMYGFLCPLERSIAHTPDIERYLDLRRFQKHELVRRDLGAFHMTADEIGRLPQCAVPWFKAPEEALGWAYPIERSTLRHGDLFRHLASVIPGEVAFASSYLKCYFGTGGESWGSFAIVLDGFEHLPHQAQQVIDAAKASFQALRTWRFLHDERRTVSRLAHIARRRFQPVAHHEARRTTPREAEEGQSRQVLTAPRARKDPETH